MKRKSQLAYSVFLAIVGCACIVAGYLFFKDSTPPTIVLLPETQVVSTSMPFTLQLHDEGSGVKRVSIVAKWGDRTLPVLEEHFPSGANTQELAFSLKDVGLKDGTLELIVTATDSARFGIGNSQTVQRTITIDNTPPRVTVKTSPPNVRRGGSAAILYSVSKEVSQTGVKANGLFFPGFRQENGDYLCFFAFPHFATMENFTPELVAVDMAGNARIMPLTVNKMFQEFKKDTIPVTQNFLDKKNEEFHKILPSSLPPIEHFVAINRDVRLANTQALMEIGRRTSADILWKGAFLALPRGAVRALFAEHRTYMWEGKEVDQQTHLGYDLASTTNAPVPAANSGKVVFAGYLGIYGNLVVIDHGLGLQSLYSHLYEIRATEGQTVNRGDIIGLTGISGMALGDHLHFGILMSGLEVAPLEWLDSGWIRDNIIKRVKEAGGNLPAFTLPANAAAGVAGAAGAAAAGNAAAQGKKKNTAKDKAQGKKQGKAKEKRR